MDITNAVVQEYSSRVRGLASSMQRPGESVDELTQDAWLGVLEAKPFDPDLGEFSQHLFAGARRGVLDGRRSRNGDERTYRGQSTVMVNRHTELYGSDPEPDGWPYTESAEVGPDDPWCLGALGWDDPNTLETWGAH